MHLGHYKALFAKHEYSNVLPLDPSLRQNDADRQAHQQLLNLKAKYNHMQQSLVELHLSWLKNALERGYSFK